MDNINTILKNIPKWSGIKGITYEPLNGGLSNVTYKVKVDNKFYVLRINSNQNEYLDLRREEEQDVIIEASKLGIAPSVFSTANKNDFLITEFIEGKSKDKENINKYCHNEYHTAYNMILNEEKLTVIDWELSGIGDVFFDLATISSDNGFGVEEDKVLLESYFGVFDKEQLTTLNDMKFICMLREIAWALMHEGMNIERVNFNMNYYEFANHVLDRLDQGLVTF